jgi:hypothetical protein
MSNTAAVLFSNPTIDLLSSFFQDRIYYIDPVDSCNSGWYISSDTGRSYGPFLTKKDADRELNKLTT